MSVKYLQDIQMQYLCRELVHYLRSRTCWVMAPRYPSSCSCSRQMLMHPHVYSLLVWADVRLLPLVLGLLLSYFLLQNSPKAAKVMICFFFVNVSLVWNQKHSVGDVSRFDQYECRLLMSGLLGVFQLLVTASWSCKCLKVAFKKNQFRNISKITVKIVFFSQKKKKKSVWNLEFVCRIASVQFYESF